MARNDNYNQRVFLLINVLIALCVKLFVVILVIFVIFANLQGSSWIKTSGIYGNGVKIVRSDEKFSQIQDIDIASISHSEWSNALKTPATTQNPYMSSSKVPNPTAPAINISITQTPVIGIGGGIPTTSGDPMAVGAIISPLQGIRISDLSNIISQQFIAPPPGEDTGHHGVDFAYWQFGEKGSIQGTPIIAVFGGKVSSVTSDKPPYGNMILIETPIQEISQSIIDKIKFSEQVSIPAGTEKLTCPTEYSNSWNSESRSLYTLYGHLKESPSFSAGNIITQGEVLGNVGNSGMSSAPHLHLEMRIGPSDAEFESIGHYSPSVSDLERHNYCVWRVSGVFRVFDPMVLYLSQ